MSITNKEYLSIFDMELYKAKQTFDRDDKDFVIAVSYQTLSILLTSPNFLLVKKDKGIEYYYRGIFPIILDKNLGGENEEFVFKEAQK